MRNEKELLFDIEAREKIKQGVDKLANAVKVTLGAKGRNVVIESDYGYPIITKDGVTVAKSIFLEDKFENLGAQLIKEVASRTNDSAGDGTTTSSVLAQSIYNTGIKYVTAGANPIDLKRGIDKAVASVVKSLHKQAKPIKTNKEIEQIATISGNNESSIGKMIANAMEKVGKDGVITIETANGTKDELKTVEGMQFDRGFISPYFVTDGTKMEAVYENPYILLCDKKISAMKDLILILERVQQTGRALIIIAENIEGEAINALIMNKVKAGLKVVAVKAPEFGEKKNRILKDIATLTGATVFSDSTGTKTAEATLDQLGEAKKIVVSGDSTTIIEGLGLVCNIDKRKKELKEQIKNETGNDKLELKERLAKLSGGVAVIYVGANTELELGEKRDRYDDALHATRAAVEEGIVAGGGTALINALSSLEKVKTENADESLGFNIIKTAIESPLRTIVENAGLEGSVILNEVKKTGKGYNVKTDKYEDLIASGVIDPVKVTRLALENSASVAGLLLTTECIVARKYKEE